MAKDVHDPREFEHLAKVDRHGVVVAMVEVASSSDWEHWTDLEGNRYVYLTDLLKPDVKNAALDLHGLSLLSPKANGQ
jgi:hypothetical protein